MPAELGADISPGSLAAAVDVTRITPRGCRTDGRHVAPYVEFDQLGPALFLEPEFQH